MALINLQTDLKSLRYGKDTQGGGDSGQPYIKKTIPRSFVGASEDFLLRGGINAVTDSLTDVARLAKMFTDTKSPNGLLFIAKQQLLSRTASPAQGGTPQSPRLLNEGVYNPLSTLAQAGVVAFGGHLNKQGINPFAETGAYSKNPNLYFNKAKASNLSADNYIRTDEVVTQADTITIPIRDFNSDLPYADQIYNGFDILGNDTTQFSISKVTSADFQNRLANLWYNKVEQKTSDILVDKYNVLTYNGGPGSILGIGKTNIRFADQRTGVNSDKPITGGVTWTPNQSINREFTTLIGIETSKGASKAYATTNGLTLDNDVIDGTRVYNSAVGLNAKLFNPLADSPITWTPKREQTKPDRILPLGLTTKAYIFENPEKDDLIFNSTVTGSINYQLNREPSVYKSGSLNNTDLIYANNTYTYTQKQILENPYGNENTGETISSRSNVGKLNGSPIWQDFRKKIRETLGENSEQVKKAKEKGALPNSPNYAFKGIENRVNIGGTSNLGPGNSTLKNLSSYTAGSGIGPIDKINALSIYRSENVTNDFVKNDLVKFRIAVIDNNSPNFKTFIHFRAFIDSMSDSYNATWNGFNYLGRSEQFYNYGGFTRTVSLSWTVSAQSKQELIPMYKKLNYLASSLTGDYSSDGYMRGNLVQLTIGGYLYEQPGIITSLTYDVPTESPWEIGINDEGGFDSNVKELPHIIRVTGFNFIPIQNFVPQKQQLTFGDNNNPGTTNNNTGFVKTEGFERYIALANGDDTNSSLTNYTNPS
jgi:hypothetical protein